MRLAGKIFTYIGLALVVVVGVAFAFIELRSLFAGDFSLFNNPASAFFKYLCRGLYYVSLVGASILTIVLLIKNKKSNVYVATFTAALLIGSCFTFIFYQYYFAIGVILMALILFLIDYVYLPKKEINDTPQEQ